MVIFWFRRDLRLNDNAGLYQALKDNKEVLPIFIFDKNILDKLSAKDDARVSFLHNTISHLKKELQAIGSDLQVFYNTPLNVYKKLTKEYNIEKVYTNRDYEPYAQNRDKEIFDFLNSLNIPFIGKKDHVIFEKNEVLKKDGKPYTVFTPYSKIWKSQLSEFYYQSYPTLKYAAQFKPISQTSDLISLSEMGFEKSKITVPDYILSKDILNYYHKNRDIPSLDGTTKISTYLRFGLVSIREMVQKALLHNETWLNELIWRDFYQMILFHFPHSVEKSFKPQYDNIPWENNEAHFEKWCEGKTGYPMVDAGMRELNATGFMHNRVRMVTASFLTKHLLIDWKWGERYFAEKLFDFDLASNIGGWQWAASSGCDAAPYFRVFNPSEQHRKFDPNDKYIKKWIPEFGTNQYPEPIVEHKMARQKAIDTYKEALNG